MKRIPELDGLRGIAVLLVVVFHYFVGRQDFEFGSIQSQLFALGRLSWTGVDLFFVLSGFLIGGILIDARDTPNYFRVFYVRRFFRIIPLYLAWLSVVCVAMRFLTAELLQTDKSLPMWSFAVLLQNFWMASRNTFMNPSTAVTWSLAVEEQFYFTIPFIIRFAPKKWLPWIVAGGIASAPTMRMALYFLWPTYSIARFVLMPLRADALLLGVAGAMLMRDENSRYALKAYPALLHSLALVLLLGMVVLTYRNAAQTGLEMTVGLTWIALFYLCVLLIAITQTGGRLATVLRVTSLRFVGSIAYGVYLFHTLFLVLAYRLLWSTSIRELRTPSEWAVTFASAGATVVICWLSWSCFEAPLVALGHRWSYSAAEGSTP